MQGVVGRPNESLLFRARAHLGGEHVERLPAAQRPGQLVEAFLSGQIGGWCM